MAHHGGMNWHALISGELPDSDLWLLAVFDRFSDASEPAACHAAKAREKIIKTVHSLLLFVRRRFRFIGAPLIY